MVRARSLALKTACECCGRKDRLAIHHINEDWQDESPENLQTLCVNCHQQWHGLHRKLGLPCSVPMPSLASLLTEGVTTYVRIAWGNFAPTETRSMLKRRQASWKP